MLGIIIFGDIIALMIVYIEYVLLDNFIIDFLILYAVAKILKLRISKARFLLALVLAVGFAVITPFLNIAGALLFFVKLLMGAIIVGVAFKLIKVKQFILAYLCFVFATFLMGGICYGLQGFFSGMQIIGTRIDYQSDFPISLIFIGIGVFYLGGKNIYFALRQKKHNARICVVFCGHTLELLALVDSGNQLLDESTKRPITFISRLKFSSVTTSAIDKLRGYEQVICSTVGGKYNVVDTFIVDKLIVSNGKTLINARVAVVDLSTNQGCDAIISDKVFD